MTDARRNGHGIGDLIARHWKAASALLAALALGAGAGTEWQTHRNLPARMATIEQKVDTLGARTGRRLVAVELAQDTLGRRMTAIQCLLLAERYDAQAGDDCTVDPVNTIRNLVGRRNGGRR